VQVDVIEELLVPGVENGGEADSSSEPTLGIGAELVKGVGNRLEEDIEDDLLVAQSDGVELVGKGEDGVMILHGEKFGAPRFEPLGLRQRLTLWAMAVAAGVIGVALEAAVIAPVDMPSESCRTTDLDGAHDLEMAEREAMGTPVGLPVKAKEVSDFPVGSFRRSRRATHSGRHGDGLLSLLREDWLEQIQKVCAGVELLAGQLEVANGRADRLVAHEHLDRSDIDAGLEQVGREAMAKGVNASCFLDAGFDLGRFVDLADGLSADVAVRMGAGKHPDGRPLDLPVGAQLMQQPFRENGVSVLFPFALVDTNHHAIAVDIAHFQAYQFGAPEARGIGCHQQHAMLRVRRDGEKLFDLVGAEDLRQRPRRPARRDVGGDVLALQRLHIEKPDRGDLDVDGRPTQLPLVHQVEQIVLDLFQADPIRRTVMVFDQPCDGVRVSILRSRGEAPKLHLPNHPISQLTHSISSIAKASDTGIPGGRQRRDRIAIAKEGKGMLSEKRPKAGLTPHQHTTAKRFSSIDLMGFAGTCYSHIILSDTGVLIEVKLWQALLLLGFLHDSLREKCPVNCLQLLSARA